MSTKSKTTPKSDLQRAIRRQARGLIAGLLFVGVLGFLTSRGGELPARHPGAGDASIGGAVSGWSWAISAHGGVSLALHVLLGSVLLITMTALAVKAFAQDNKIWKIASIAGACAIVLAFVSGLTFINTGGSESASTTMATGAILAVIIYGTALMLTRSDK